MRLPPLELAGLILSALLCFLMSLFHTTFSYYSRIGFSRLLGQEKNQVKQKILDHYDELKIAVDYARMFFFLAFLVYAFLLWPKVNLWPLWLFLGLVLIYLILFDYLPRLTFYLLRERGLLIFLPALRGLIWLLTPALILPRFLLKKEEKRQPAVHTHEASDQEIDTFIYEATEEGIIEKDQNELLRGVVEFGDQLVREIMTPRTKMVAIEREATIRELKELICREKYSRIPVYKDRLDNIEGMVIAKDLLQYTDEQQISRKIDFLIRPVVFVPETMMVKELLKEFKKARQKMAIVVDEYGGVAGLVTMEDLLEEIVGDIQDEYDVEEPQIIVEKPETFLIRGETEIEDLEEILKTDLAEADYLTVNGLLNQYLGRLPRKGEKVKIGGFNFEVLEVDEKSIKRVRLTRSTSEPHSGTEQEE
ncbi:MAG TPA: hemolysin family protein [Candidatus Saccharicenans sp.]|nr:CBS domain-containing protein [Candidatus Saccharicenans sp.]HRD02694.1 hemolysin family protein [Candidatus Saccharicenans sp.]